MDSPRDLQAELGSFETEELVDELVRRVFQPDPHRVTGTLEIVVDAGRAQRLFEHRRHTRSDLVRFS